MQLIYQGEQAPIARAGPDPGGRHVRSEGGGEEGQQAVGRERREQVSRIRTTADFAAIFGKMLLVFGCIGTDLRK